jgi:ubiquitin carboxyl-terminal hydrolase 5/13
MASTLQSLFSLPSFRTRYYLNYSAHPLVCTNPSPSSCIECQINKVADGLLSGRYAVPRSLEDTTIFPGEDSQKRFQEGIKPIGFKTLIGKDHQEFSSMRQQDADEFFKHLLSLLSRDAKRLGASDIEKPTTTGSLLDPTEVFRFELEERLQCGECKGVRIRVEEVEGISIPVPAKEKVQMEIEGKESKKEYESVELDECLKGMLGVEAIEWNCPKCEKAVIATK